MLHLTLQAIGEYKSEGNKLAAKHVGIAMGICLLLRGTRHNAKRQSSPAPLSIPYLSILCTDTLCWLLIPPAMTIRFQPFARLTVQEQNLDAQEHVKPLQAIARVGGEGGTDPSVGSVCVRDGYACPGAP
jgi:hypothetical protein